jgi:hypothetical protein
MTEHSQISAARQTGLLLLVAISMWVLCAGPAYWLRGSLALEGLTYAGILCLIPGLVVVYVTSRFPGGGSPGTGVLLGTGLRLAFVLIGMVMIQNLRPELGHYGFQLWLILYYLAFLTVETLIVIKSTETQDN